MLPSKENVLIGKLDAFKPCLPSSTAAAALSFPSLGNILLMWASFLLLAASASFTQQAPLLEEPRDDALSVSLSQGVPDTASTAVDPSFVALAFSAHSFQEYAGNTSSPNQFSANLINEISSRIGVPVHIRVGGTSGDFSVYVPEQEDAITLPPGSAPGSIPKGIRVGQAWFQGFASFPGVQWTYMAHLANDSAGMQANSVSAVQEALKYIGDNLEALEIGNEIDFYANVNRPADYSTADYVAEWKDYEAAIAAAVGDKSYQAPVYANNNCPWCLVNTFNLGQDSLNNVHSVSLHHYINGDNVPVSEVQSLYMNHTRIVTQIDTAFKPPVAFLAENYPDIPLYLGEVNSNTYSTDNYDVLGTFGNALWLVDFLLYSATVNIKRVNVQQSTGFSYASWRGVEYNGLPAAVLPPYYAHPFVADVFGNAGAIRISELAFGQDMFSGYEIYDAASGQLKRVVLINLERYDSSAGGSRPSKPVLLSTGAYGGSGTATVEKLTSAGAEIQDAAQISWKGDSWTYASNGKAVAGASTTEVVNSSQGKYSVSVKASEAVLITF